MKGLHGGTGGDSIHFDAHAPDDVRGIRLTSKICELCGKGFLRDGGQRECKPCEARLATPAAPIPGETESDLRRARWYEHYAKKSAANRERDRRRKAQQRRRQAQSHAKIHLQARWARLEKAHEGHPRAEAS